MYTVQVVSTSSCSFKAEILKMALAIGIVGRMYIPMMRRGEETLICPSPAHESTRGHDLSMTGVNLNMTGVNISLIQAKELSECGCETWRTNFSLPSE